MQDKTLAELAEHVGGKVHGDETIIIKAASTLGRAGPDEITFLGNRKYQPQIKTTHAAAIIIDSVVETDAALLIADDPYYAFMQIVLLLHGHRKHKKIGISPQVSIADSAKIGPDCDIHDFVTICDDARIGRNCRLYPGVFIGPDVKVGSDCIFYSNAVIYDSCRIGNRVIIHANATIGQDGFGFATHQGVHHKIPQIGKVILENDVEIGSNCAIERGTLEDTIIAQGSKIGDLVAIGHGSRIGSHSLLVPQVGIAGSARLGHHCVLGGQVGVVGHIKIGNMVKIGAQSGVINDIPDNAIIMGSPAIDASLGKRAYSMIQHLPNIRKSLRQLERRVADMQASNEAEQTPDEAE